MSNLTRLLVASRPFRPFKAVIGDQEFELQARKPSLLDQRSIDASFSDTYSETLVKYAESGANTADIFAGIRRLPPDKLARYIAMADRRDLANEAASDLEKDIDDIEVIELTNEKVKERQTYLQENVPAEKMIDLAMQRRSHFYALSQANEASSRMMASTVIYEMDGSRFFPDSDNLLEMPLDDLVTLVAEAGKALNPPKAVDEPGPLM